MKNLDKNYCKLFKSIQEVKKIKFNKMKLVNKINFSKYIIIKNQQNLNQTLHKNN